MKKTTLLALTVLMLGGCAMNASTVNFATLSDKTFLLQQVDEKPVAQREHRQPEIAFSAEGRVSGQMCNRFFGQGELNGQKLTVKQMGATRMLCPDDQLNQWDSMIGDVLSKGVDVSLSGKTLTLKGVDHTLVYQQK